MLPSAQTPQEKARQEQFYKEQIQKTWKIIDTKDEGYVDKREISYIMRYLL